MNETMTIGAFDIGASDRVFIIAELSANHEQDLDLAVRTLEAMKEAGADAVKVQTFRPEGMTLDSDQPWFQTSKEGPWAGMKLFDLYTRAALPWEWHAELQQLVNGLGMIFFSSPFHPEAVEFLESLQVPAYKIASFEITDIPLIEQVARTGKPIIISTGVASEEDIRSAVDTCRNAGNSQIALLKCTSAYPTPLETVNLRAIPRLQEEFGTIVGLSDHTTGTSVPIAAVSLGARIVEKHFILDRKGNSLDREFSLEPAEFKQLVSDIREIEQALGEASLQPTQKMEEGRKMARSLFAVRDISRNEPLTLENIGSLRPALGLHPKHLGKVIGKKAASEIGKGTPITWDLIE